MGSAFRVVVVIGIAAALCVPATAGSDDNTLPKTFSEALKRAEPLIEAARGAKSAETPEIAKGIRRAVDWMQPFRKAGSESTNFSHAWNEALTLSKFHGNKPTGEYILAPGEAIYTGAVQQGKLRYGTPAGRGWCWQDGQSGPNLQSWGEIRHELPDGTLLAKIRVSVYRFSTIYSGVDGADATGLAEIFFKLHRGKMTKLVSRSPQVNAKPLSRGFPRANYFEIVGGHADDGTVRMRSWFAKTSNTTIEFDAIEYRGASDGTSPVQDWQRNVQSPELEAALQSILVEDARR
jgi:hypothetical protein